MSLSVPLEHGDQDAEGVYVVDLDGASMQRLAGAAAFPAQITVPLAVGPAIPRQGTAASRAVFGDPREADPEHLDDDATIIVLAPSGMTGAIA